eukprot:1896363-Alexandrium_andersonii.AAC.1
MQGPRGVLRGQSSDFLPAGSVEVSRLRPQAIASAGGCTSFSSARSLVVASVKHCFERPLTV